MVGGSFSLFIHLQRAMDATDHTMMKKLIVGCHKLLAEMRWEVEIERVEASAGLYPALWIFVTLLVSVCLP
jgi:hypothetical protein